MCNTFLPSTDNKPERTHSVKPLLMPIVRIFHGTVGLLTSAQLTCPCYFKISKRFFQPLDPTATNIPKTITSYSSSIFALSLLLKTVQSCVHSVDNCRLLVYFNSLLIEQQSKKHKRFLQGTLPQIPYITDNYTKLYIFKLYLIRDLIVLIKNST